MIRSLYLSFGLCFVVAGASLAVAQTAQTDAAVQEAVRRQANTVLLQQKIEAAQAAERRGDLGVAVKLYEDGLLLVEKIGPGNIEAETAAVVRGLTDVGLSLAAAAQKRYDLTEADVRVSRVLKINPQSQEALAFKADNDKRLKEMAGMVPDREYIERIPEWTTNRINNSTKIQNAKLLYENGQYEEAETLLKQVMKDEPGNYTAAHYSSLIKERIHANKTLDREIQTKGNVLEVEKAWETPIDRQLLPVPNPVALTNLIHTSKQRQETAVKMERIRLDNVLYDGLPLSEVIRNLAAEVKRRDPDKKGINFILAPGADGAGSGAAGATMIDPVTQLPVNGGGEEESLDLGSIAIKINPAISDIRLKDLLDILLKVAERPIKFSIEDYGIVFSLKRQEAGDPLHVRYYKIDPNTFWTGLGGVQDSNVGNFSTGTGGGGRNSGRSGQTGGIGGGAGGGGSGGTSVPRVSVTSGSSTIGGMAGITSQQSISAIQTAVRDFFGSLGVDLTPPKNVFYNDRSGTLFVRATLRELDLIEQAVQVLNIIPPLVNVSAKFAEINQDDSRALGFDWYLGNTLLGGKDIGMMGGTAPSYTGAPSTANPNGFFPGTSTDYTFVPSATDQLITSGVRQSAPALATITGILTDPQFRVVIRAMEQRQGIEVLSAPNVTTVSGRQAQLQVTDSQTVVTGNDFNQTSAGGGGQFGGGGGAVGTTSQFNTESMATGPSLDVVPYVSADGFTIQMVCIPTVTEFVGYDDPGEFVAQAQSVSSGASGASTPITAQLPLPRTRVRQVTTTSIVWDGQTIALGGLLSENVTKTKDKVPVMGDLPFFGRFFRSESNVSQKKNLVIFVTPTILDPAGNRVHTEADLPFRKNNLPPQRPVQEVGAVAR